MKKRIMKTVALAFVAAAVMMPVSAAQAGLTATVDLSKQRMNVYIDGIRKYTWKVSTGKKGYTTPTGSFTPYNMKKLVISKKWNMTLPNTIWINGSIAVHGTYLTKGLGKVASHGCIRLAPKNAEKFYSLVQDYGMWFTTVKVVK
jgi:lipoprotein-anchoring transpeptidase ErfK/SrfK